MSWNRVAVVGAGLIKMGELFDQSYEQMAAGAFAAAVASVDKGFEPELVDAAFVATQRGTLWGQEGIGGNTVPSAIGLSGIPCTRIENACPSGSDAFRVGAMAVASGVHDVVLVIGVEKMRDKSTEEGLLSRAAAGHPIFTRGETAPVLFAPFATRHMAEYGTTREMLASVAVKNHYNGARDPYAHFQNEITVEDVLASVPVCHPCTCSTAARRPTAPPRCCSSRPSGPRSSPTGRCGSRASVSRPIIPTCTRSRRSPRSRPRASRPSAAYTMAGVGPEQIDCAEVHDCFTITEILDIEDLGFVEKGRGGVASLEGETALDGRIPVNTSGGLLAKGHPIGATGVAQITECWWQLRGDAGERQIETRNGYALQHNAGGRGSGVAVVNILTNQQHDPRRAAATTTSRASCSTGPRRRTRSRPRCATSSSPRCDRAAPIPRYAALLITGVGDAFCAGMDLGASTVAQAGREGFEVRSHVGGAARGRAGVHPRAVGARQADRRRGQRCRGRPRRAPRARVRLRARRAHDPLPLVVPPVGARRRRRRRVPAAPARRPATREGDVDARRRRGRPGGRRPRPRVQVRRGRRARRPRRPTLARRLAAGPTRAFGLTKRCSTRASRPTSRTRSSSKATSRRWQRRPRDLREGMTAFREKRGHQLHRHMTRFPIRYTLGKGLVLRLVGAPKRRAYIEVDGRTRPRPHELGVPHELRPQPGRVGGADADGFGSRRVCTVGAGAGSSTARRDRSCRSGSTPRRGRGSSAFPIRLRELSVSVADPDALIAALS